MIKKIFFLVCASVMTFLISTAVFAQEAPAHEKMEKKGKVACWEGNVVRSDSGQSTLTVL